MGSRTLPGKSSAVVDTTQTTAPAAKKMASAVTPPGRPRASGWLMRAIGTAARKRSANAVLAAGGQQQGPANGGHLRRSERADEMMELALMHRLEMVQVDRRRVLQAFLGPQQHLAGCAMDRRGDRRHEHRVEQTDRHLSREHEHRPALVG